MEIKYLITRLEFCLYINLLRVPDLIYLPTAQRNETKLRENYFNKTSRLLGSPSIELRLNFIFAEIYYVIPKEYPYY